ncbi:hypothetical protein [Bradyrhizobium sp.]|uniref:hypothetical protein n=1 Tax=Bradyrhizobium sp. TaxID=376 RepID=UPI0039E381C4
MISTRAAFAALIIAGLALAPFAAEAKRQRTVRHHSAYAMSPTTGTAGVTAAQPRSSYGTSGQTVGTVTAPSVGTYNWPSVGVTNSVPTWNNTTR